MRYSVLIVASIVSIILAGCDSRTGKITAFAKPAPDEFQVAPEKPLILPPAYAERPTEEDIASNNETLRQTVFGVNNDSLLSRNQDDLRSKGYSQAEIELLQKVGVQENQPDIRRLLNQDEAHFSNVTPTVADKILFWRDEYTNETLLDASQENKRLQQEQAQHNAINDSAVATQEKKHDTTWLDHIDWPF